ncbi:MAG: class I SAM-dependent methyltransferase [bacterium]|nr:class I SAM-dependent methyltransferase [bacterium]
MIESNVPSIYDLYKKHPWVWELVNNERVRDEVDCILEILSRYVIGKSLLDLGCGTGHHAAKLAEYGYEVLGCDINEHVISMAKQTHNSLGTLSFEIGDMCNLRYESKFHAILCLQSVFSYNLTFEDIIYSLRGIHKCLLPVGLVIIDVLDILALFKGNRFMIKRELVFNGNGSTIHLKTDHEIDQDMQAMITNRKWQIESDDTIYFDRSVARLFFPQELNNLLRSTGFEIIDSGSILPYKAQMPDRLIVVARKEDH